MVTITVKDGSEIQKTSNEKAKGLIHNVFILDASGSMSTRNRVGDSYRSKYEVAIEGINNEIRELKAQTNPIKVSVFEFDSIAQGEERITEHCFTQDVKDIEMITGRGASGNTPLYQTIGYVVEKLLRKVSNNDIVILSIYTDGAHNCFWGKYAQAPAMRDLISDIEKNRNFTVTFVGTTVDTALAIRDLGISIGNTIAYDGTAGEFSKKFSSATRSKLNSISTYYSTGSTDWMDNTLNQDSTGSPNIAQTTNLNPNVLGDPNAMTRSGGTMTVADVQKRVQDLINSRTDVPTNSHLPENMPKSK